MKKAFLILAGSELLDFKREDRNGKLLAGLLAERNISLSGYEIVEDDEKLIASAFQKAMAFADIVVSSGGIGPTGDDLTREALASALGRKLVSDDKWLARIKEKISLRGREPREFDFRMALVPEGGEAIPNEHGLAAGIFYPANGRSVFVLPGVPAEFEQMLRDEVLPVIDRDAAGEKPLVISATLSGIRESDVQEFLKDHDGVKGVKYSILPHFGVLDLKFVLTGGCASEEKKSEILGGLASRFPGNVVSLEGKNIVEVIAAELAKRSYGLAVAESLTGGTVSKKIVSLPGASSFYKGSVTAYSNEAKAELLGVPEEMIRKHGAVSEEVALAMARGARARFIAPCAVSTTGIAGPSGATAEKPLGLVYIAVSRPGREEVHRHVFPFSRESVVEMASNFALHHLLKLLRNEN